MKNLKFAFTLAEVLIVLAIIGVVSSLTIPSLVQNFKKQEYVAGLKKFYAEANQALMQTAIDECSPGDLKCFDDWDTMEDAIVHHFKVIKDCGENNTGNCWVLYNKDFDGTGEIVDFPSMHTFITADGMSVGVDIYPDTYDCLGHYDSNPGSPMYNYCGEMYVDVNGPKGPNLRGRDVFIFNITSNKAPLLYPWGGKDEFASDGSNYYWKGPDNQSCQDKDNPNGEGCTGRIMEEGWQMNY